jgi:hypothetical protein
MQRAKRPKGHHHHLRSGETPAAPARPPGRSAPGLKDREENTCEATLARYQAVSLDRLKKQNASLLIGGRQTAKGMCFSPESTELIRDSLAHSIDIDLLPSARGPLMQSGPGATQDHMQGAVNFFDKGAVEAVLKHLATDEIRPLEATGPDPAPRPITAWLAPLRGHTMVGKVQDFAVQAASLLLASTNSLERVYLGVEVPTECNGGDLYFWQPHQLFALVPDLIVSVTVHKGALYSIHDPPSADYGYDLTSLMVVELGRPVRFRPWAVQQITHYETSSTETGPMDVENSDGQALLREQGSRLQGFLDAEDSTLLVHSLDNGQLRLRAEKLDQKAVIDDVRREPGEQCTQWEVTFTTAPKSDSFLNPESMWKEGARLGDEQKKDFLKSWEELKIHIFPKKLLVGGGFSLVCLWPQRQAQASLTTFAEKSEALSQMGMELIAALPMGHVDGMFMAKLGRPISAEGLRALSLRNWTAFSMEGMKISTMMRAVQKEHEVTKIAATSELRVSSVPRTWSEDVLRQHLLIWTGSIPSNLVPLGSRNGSKIWKVELHPPPGPHIPRKYLLRSAPPLCLEGDLSGAYGLSSTEIAASMRAVNEAIVAAQRGLAQFKQVQPALDVWGEEISLDQLNVFTEGRRQARSIPKATKNMEFQLRKDTVKLLPSHNTKVGKVWEFARAGGWDSLGVPNPALPVPHPCPESVQNILNTLSIPSLRASVFLVEGSVPSYTFTPKNPHDASGIGIIIANLNPQTPCPGAVVFQNQTIPLLPGQGILSVMGPIDHQPQPIPDFEGSGPTALRLVIFTLPPPPIPAKNTSVTTIAYSPIPIIQLEATASLTVGRGVGGQYFESARNRFSSVEPPSILEESVYETFGGSGELEQIAGQFSITNLGQGFRRVCVIQAPKLGGVVPPIPTQSEWRTGAGLLLVSLLRESLVRVHKDNKVYLIRIEEGGWYYVPSLLLDSLSWEPPSGTADASSVLLAYYQGEETPIPKRLFGEEDPPSQTLALLTSLKLEKTENETEAGLLSRLASATANPDAENLVEATITDPAILLGLSNLVAMGDPKHKRVGYGLGLKVDGKDVALDPTLDSPIPECIHPLLSQLGYSHPTTVVQVIRGAVSRHKDRPFLRPKGGKGTMAFTSKGTGSIFFTRCAGDNDAITLEASPGHVYGVPTRIGAITEHEVKGQDRVSVVLFALGDQTPQ